MLDTGLDYLKAASKKAVHKAGKFLGNKIADTVTKSNDYKIVKTDMLKEQLFHQKKEMKY